MEDNCFSVSTDIKKKIQNNQESSQTKAKVGQNRVAGGQSPDLQSNWECHKKHKKYSKRLQKRGTDS